MLIVKNVLRFGATATIGGIFMFIGKLLIVCLNVLACYLMLIYWEKPRNEIESPFFPCLIAGLIGYVVGAIVMSIFSFASDTIL